MATTKKRSGKQRYEEDDEPETLEETEALSQIIFIMDSLDEDQQQGVIGYLRGRYPREE